MSRSRVDNKVYEYIAEIIENSGAKAEDKIKIALLSNKYYSDLKEELDAIKAPSRTRIKIITEFILFMIRFETICMRAFKPMTGSLSVGREIMKIQSQKIKSDLLGNNLINDSKKLKIVQ